jgi:hypothetical protein
MSRNNNTTKGNKPNKKFGKQGGKAKPQGKKTGNFSKDRESRSDIMSDSIPSNAKKFPNKPEFYYGDMVLGDELSRFAFNCFVGQTPHSLTYNYGKSLPTVAILPINPCPGVTYVNPETHEYETDDKKGINLALQQWWSITTAESGRGATWSKVDLGALMLAEGEVISTLEHLRRFFGLAFTYNLRNRLFPKKIFEYMGIDGDDFLSRLADYRLELNTLIGRINQIPIPAGVKYFAKCQDLYQRVFSDSPSAMAQLIIPVPATTWTIDEQAVETGTVLKTTSAYFTVDPETGKVTRQTRKFSDLLKDLNRMINALLGSTTFSLIYADFLNAADRGRMSLWTFELVSEVYSVTPEYNEYYLLSLHNAMPTGRLNRFDNDTRSAYYGSTGIDQFKLQGSFLNDVICDPDNDVLLHNPAFPTWRNGQEEKVPAPPIVVDMLNANATAEERIEACIYKYALWDNYYSVVENNNQSHYINNLDLPDHYVNDIIIYGDSAARLVIFSIPSSRYLDDDDTLVVSYVDNANNVFIADAAYMYTKFQWMPLWYTDFETFGDEMRQTAPLGELNYYTLLDNGWVNRVNDAKYLGLFEAR